MCIAQHVAKRAAVIRESHKVDAQAAEDERAAEATDDGTTTGTGTGAVGLPEPPDVPSTNARKGNTKEIGGHLDSEVAVWCSGHGPG